MALNQANTALILIDIQDAFTDTRYWGPSRSNPSFEKNSSLLLNKYRSLAASSTQHRVIHVIHSSVHPESPLHASKPTYAVQAFATPLKDETVIVKSVNSGFIGTNLEEVLRGHFGGKAGRLWLIGLTTDHCVSTTTRMASNLGVADGVDGKKGDIILVEDATAAWKKGEGDQYFDAETVHKVNVESLRNEFAIIAKTANALDEWSALLGVQ